MKIRIVAHHECAPLELFRINTNWQYFEEFTKDFVRFKNLPIGEMHQGQDVQIQSAPKGSDKFMNWQIKFVDFSEEEMRFETFEKGGAIKNWKHVAKVCKGPKGAQLIDEIDIDAGILTLFFALWAKAYYGGRIKPRQAIIDRLMARENGNR